MRPFFHTSGGRMEKSEVEFMSDEAFKLYPTSQWVAADASIAACGPGKIG